MEKAGTVKKCGCCHQNFIAPVGKENRQWCDFCNKWYNGTEIEPSGKMVPVYRKPWVDVKSGGIFIKPNPECQFI